MTLEEGYWISQISAATILVITAIAIFVEVRLARRNLALSSFQATASRMIELSRTMLEHPDALIRLQADELPTGADAALAEVILDTFDTELLRADNFSTLEPRNAVPLEPWMRAVFEEHAGLRRLLRERQSWYSTRLATLAAEGMPLSPPGE